MILFYLDTHILCVYTITFGSTTYGVKVEERWILGTFGTVQVQIRSTARLPLTFSRVLIHVDGLLHSSR